ncbi:ATPase AAA-type core [Penicillium atrosanguineum]|nr:ATPase AAA-type core [Penicillium atrosanguineum]KAJ5148011.1 ATPase AAA-type core [Penicillium atrosanguineum]
MDTTKSLTGEKCEFKAYRHSKTKNGDVSITPISNPFGQAELSDKDSSYALIVNRFLGEKNQLEKTTLQVNSTRLLQVFQNLIGSYPTIPADFTQPFELESPFQILLHYWKELDQLRKSTKDADERMHLNLLVDFMDNEIGPERDRLLSMLRKNQITFYDAWCIFRPGDLVYTEFMGHPWLLKCKKTAYEENLQSGPYMEVHCTYTSHDGTLEGEASRTFLIYQKSDFAAENPAIITDLPCYPRIFVKEQEDLEERMTARGQSFLALKGVKVMSYDGQAQYLKEPPYGWYNPHEADLDAVWLPYTELGRVMLDRKTFHEDQYSNAVRVQVKTPDPLLCPPYEVRFSLPRKEWCRFFIKGIREVQWKENAWDSLIIGDHEKLVLQSLVTSHSYPDDSRDQILQKGKGLVILLHGSPGSRKTLKTETAAEGTRRALMMASLGELNKSDNPWAFERSLKLLLQYATVWKTVVLMDEVDVFLEAREDHGASAHRNALVAVFLKELEYFSGIVFLTTNRIKSFDKAMKSRIHLALKYTPPGLETRYKLWM